MDSDNRPLYEEFDSVIPDNRETEPEAIIETLESGDGAEMQVEAEAVDEAAEIQTGVWTEPFPIDARTTDLEIEAKIGWWERIRRWLQGEDSAEDFESRLRDLDRAVEHAPDAPANYVVRGELYLKAREYELAALDFERALALTGQQVEANDWGLVAQALQDRAGRGLTLANKKLKT